MIISPNSDNFAALQPAADYTVSLPEMPINLEPSKTVSITKNIVGGAIIEAWDADISGLQIIFSVAVTQQKYNILKKIKDSKVDEWLIRTHGKRFNAVFDLAASVRIPNSEKYKCSLNIVIISELY